MKIKILVFIFVLILNHGVSASEESNFHVAIKAGKLRFDSPDGGQASYGIQLGYNVHSNFYVELEHSQGNREITLATGVLDEAGELSAVFNSVDPDYDVTALYGTYRSPGKLYFLGKLGYQRVDVSVNLPSGKNLKGHDSELSYGLGAGYRFSDKLSAELEYTYLTDFLTFASLSARVSF